jgi:hypothetical protein
MLKCARYPALADCHWDGRRRNRDGIAMGPRAFRIGALAAMLLLLPVAVRADCTVSDLFNSLDSAVGALLSPACGAACSTGVGCFAAGAVDVVLEGMSSESEGKAQGQINQFCSAVGDAINGVNSGTDKANTVAGLVKNVDASAGKSLQQALESAGSDVLSVLGAAQCGCELYQGLGQLGDFLGACIKDALCALDNAIFSEPCQCIAPPPILANCSPSAVPCTDLRSDPNDPQGKLVVPAACNTTIAWPDQEGSAKPRITQGPDGSQLVTLDLGSSDASGHCAPKEYCYCPSPMKVTINPVYINGVKQEYGIVLCNCPDGTHAAPGYTGSNGNQPSGPVASLTYCICNNTGKPMATGPDLPFGNCPTIGTDNGCPQGQISIGSKCVTPCADPSKGMTADGKCCDPAQISSCGQCCPPGTTPDPKTGGCLPPDPSTTIK